MNEKYVNLCNEQWLAMIFIHCEHKEIKEVKPRRADEWNWKCGISGCTCDQDGCHKLNEINRRFAAQDKG